MGCDFRIHERWKRVRRISYRILDEQVGIETRKRKAVYKYSAANSEIPSILALSILICREHFNINTT